MHSCTHTPHSIPFNFLSLQLNNNKKVNIWPDAAMRKQYLGDPSTPGAPPHTHDHRGRRHWKPQIRTVQGPHHSCRAAVQNSKSQRQRYCGNDLAGQRPCIPSRKNLLPMRKTLEFKNVGK